MKILYNHNLVKLARDLRNNMTFAEQAALRALKGNQMKGYDFHRQKPLDEFIVDFFCNELMLAIEIDGISHEGQEKYDKQRQQKLESMGIKFLRFDDNEVYYKTDKVLKEIKEWIKKNT